MRYYSKLSGLTLEASGGSEIGSGHIQRILTLSEALAPFIDELDGVTIRDFPPNTFPPREGGLVIDVVDHINECSGEADVVFAMLGTPEAGEGRYVGLDYTILRPEFTPQRHRQRLDGERWYDGKWRGSNVVITLGGMDPSNSTEPIQLALRKYNPMSVVSQGFTNTPKTGWVVTPIREEMANIMRTAKLCITSGGMTLFEAAAVGAPCIAIAHNKREATRLQHLVDTYPNPWFIYAGLAPIDTTKLVELVDSLVTDVSRLHEMSKNGNRLVDGEGLRRVVEVIRKKRQENGN